MSRAVFRRLRRLLNRKLAVCPFSPSSSLGKIYEAGCPDVGLHVSTLDEIVFFRVGRKGWRHRQPPKLGQHAIRLRVLRLSNNLKLEIRVNSQSSQSNAKR
jgi:hypothetical protein